MDLQFVSFSAFSLVVFYILIGIANRHSETFLTERRKSAGTGQCL